MARGKNTLVQRIALDGGRDIREELKKLGAEGEAAFNALKAAADESAKATTAFGRAMVSIRRDLNQIRAQADLVGAELNNTAGAALRVARNLTAVATAATGAVTGLFLLSKSAADIVDTQNDTAIALGLTIAEYGRLRFAFEQNGSSAEGMQTAMNRLNVAIGEAAKGSGKGAQIFEQLGVKVRDANGDVRSTELIFQDLSTAFSKLPDGALKSALAIELLGRSGAAAVQTLNLGAEAIRNLGAEAERLGIVLSSEDVQIGQALNDQFDATARVVEALRVQLGLLFAPAFTEALRQFTDVLVENRETIIALGAAFADQVIPVMQDFFALLRGDDASVSNQALLQIRDAILSIVEAFNIVASIVGFAFASIENAIQQVLDPINLVFGTDLQARTVIFTVILFKVLGVFRLLGAAVKLLQVSWVALVTLFGNTTATVTAVVAGVLLAVGAIEEAITRTVEGIGTLITDTIQAVSGGLASIFEAMFSEIEGFFNGIVDFLDKIIQVAKDAIAALFGVKDAGGNGGGGDVPIQSNKRGGPIYGRGTGTSDSILSWLSNGEFVVRAAAVKKYGVGMLTALNQGRLPGFNLGGAVSRLTTGLARPHTGVPAFAAGGLAEAGGRPLTLTIGGEVFEGLIAPEVVASKLVRYTSGRSVKRAGKTPSWHKG